MRIAPQASLVGVTPDDLKDLSPPGAVLLVGTNGVELTATCTVGTATLTPYFWASGAWCPLGDDATTPKSTKVTAAGVATGTGRFVRPAEPRWWALVTTGGGTLSDCQISEAYF